MGSFDVSCSLTGTPILTGDRCVLVALNKHFDFTRDAITVDPIFVEAVFKGVYDDYGRIAAPGVEQAEIDKYTDLERLHFFLCEAAWDWCQKRFSKLQVHRFPSPLSRLTDIPEWKDEVYRVIHAFRLIWRNPLAGYGCFYQFSGRDELETIKTLYQEVTLPRIEQMAIQIEKDNE